MSFRVEDKYIVNNEDRIKILSFIKKDGFEPAYNNRNITSIYFDNKNLSMIHDSKEGSTPRKKIRVRHYQNLNEFNHPSVINLEEKRKYISCTKLSLHKKMRTLSQSYVIKYQLKKILKLI